MSLLPYKKKRVFPKSPEPKGRKIRGKGPLKFVIQKHAATRVHYDLRLELDGVLKSWAIPKVPSLNPLDTRLAIHVEDHPIDYGKFEGVIPHGHYGAGPVIIWDQGTYGERFSDSRAASERALREGLLKGKLTVVLEGKKLRGEFALIRLKHQRGGSGKNWLWIKKRDQFAVYRPTLPEKDDESVVSARNLTQMKEPAKADEPPLTNTKKVLWPKEGYTKKDLFDYFRAVAPYMVPHLKDKPLSLHRFPNGIASQGFFQKDLTGFVPRRVRLARIKSRSSDRTIQYAVCQDAFTLLYLANLGCIEINPWLSRVQSPERPDYVVIDLDPDGNPFKEVVEIALAFRKLLQKTGCPSFPKTSGASGLHICIPLHAKYTFDTARDFAIELSQIIHEKYPDKTSLERMPARRRGKIYLDCFQNARGQTLAAPYGTRPLPKAPVSTFLKWSEVTPRLKPESFTIKTVPPRLKKVGDPGADLLRLSVDLMQLRAALSRFQHNEKGGKRLGKKTR